MLSRQHRLLINVLSAGVRLRRAGWNLSGNAKHLSWKGEGEERVGDSMRFAT